MSKSRISPKILAIGGGKGGVGKSFLSTNLAISIAKAGYRTILIDLDLGGANLHTMLGINTPLKGLAHYLFSDATQPLDTYLQTTTIPNLSLISCGGFVPGISQIGGHQKQRLLRALLNLRTDYILLDLGAGTNPNVIDFFSLTQSGILVTLPEPTAIFNAYEFIKNVLFQTFEKQFSYNPELLKLIQRTKKIGLNAIEQEAEGTSIPELITEVAAIDKDAAEQMEETCREFTPCLLLNMVGETNIPRHISESFYRICQKHLNIHLSYLGYIPQSQQITRSIQTMKPIVVSAPDSPVSDAIRTIRERCLNLDWFTRDHITRRPHPVLASDEQLQRLKDRIEPHHLGLLSSLFFRFLCHGAQFCAKHWQSERPEQYDRQLLNSDVPRFLDIQPRLAQQFIKPGYIPVIPEETPLSFLEALYRNPDHPQRAILELPTQPNYQNLLERVFKEQPQNSPAGEAWSRLGLFFVGRQDHTLAQQCFYFAWQCTPDKKREINNYAAILLHNGLVQPALEILDKGLPRYQFDLQFAFNTGLAFFQRGDFHGAWPFLDRAGRAENPAIPLQLAGYSLLRCHDYDEAKQRFLQLYRLDHLQSDALFNAGVASLRANDHQEAIELFERVIALRPTDHQAYAAAALAHWQMENDSDTLDFLQRAIDRAPGLPRYRLVRAIIAYKLEAFDICSSDILALTSIYPNELKLRQIYLSIRKALGCD